MGSSDSKPTDIDNKGMLNGNLINNGQIIEKIESEVLDIDIWLKIALGVQIFCMLAAAARYVVKSLKKKHEKEAQIEKVLVQRV